MFSCCWDGFKPTSRPADLGRSESDSRIYLPSQLRKDATKRQHLDELTEKCFHYKEVTSGVLKVRDKIFQPPADDEVVLRPNKKAMFVDSAFFSPAVHPTWEQQVQMAKRISASLSDANNKQSRGQSMYERRKRRSVKWVHQDGINCTEVPGSNNCDIPAQLPSASDGVAEPQLQSEFQRPPDKSLLTLLMHPRGQVYDLKSLSKEGCIINDKGALSPDVCSGLVKDLNSTTGKGGQIFAKRKKRAEKWVVDESHKEQRRQDDTVAPVVPTTQLQSAWRPHTAPLPPHQPVWQQGAAPLPPHQPVWQQRAAPLPPHQPVWQQRAALLPSADLALVPKMSQSNSTMSLNPVNFDRPQRMSQPPVRSSLYQQSVPDRGHHLIQAVAGDVALGIDVAGEAREATSDRLEATSLADRGLQLAEDEFAETAAQLLQPSRPLSPEELVEHAGVWGRVSSIRSTFDSTSAAQRSCPVPNRVVPNPFHQMPTSVSPQDAAAVSFNLTSTPLQPFNPTLDGRYSGDSTTCHQINSSEGTSVVFRDREGQEVLDHRGRHGYNDVEDNVNGQDAEDIMFKCEVALVQTTVNEDALKDQMLNLYGNSENAGVAVNSNLQQLAFPQPSESLLVNEEWRRQEQITANENQGNRQSWTNYNTAARGWGNSGSFYRPVTFTPSVM